MSVSKPQPSQVVGNRSVAWNPAKVYFVNHAGISSNPTGTEVPGPRFASHLQVPTSIILGQLVNDLSETASLPLIYFGR